MTPYSNIYKRFIRKITDYDLLLLENEDIEEIVNGYMDSAIVKFRECKINLRDRNDEKQAFNQTLSETEEEILAMLLVIEWLQPEINNVLDLKSILNDHDFDMYSQANHLKSKIDLKDNLQRDIDSLIINYDYDNGDIENNLG